MTTLSYSIAFTSIQPGATVTLPPGYSPTDVPPQIIQQSNATFVPSESYGSLYGGMTPSEPANLAALVLFTILWGCHVFGFYYKQWWFSIAFFIGNGLEVAGYIGRWKSSSDPGDLNFFLVQIICLTLGPAFLVGGIYYLLAKLVTIYGEQYSLLRPMHYSLIFIICDLIGLILQAVGGGMAAIALQDDKDIQPGTNIMTAGVSFQLAAMTLFIALFGLFCWRLYKSDPADHNPKYVALRQSLMFRLFPWAIAVSVLFLYIRTIYRVAELSESFTGYLMTHERYVLVLDGLMVLFGIIPLTAVHPGFALGRDVIPVKGLHIKKLQGAVQDEPEDPHTSSSQSQKSE